MTMADLSWILGNIIFPILIIIAVLRLLKRPLKIVVEKRVNKAVNHYTDLVNRHLGGMKRTIIEEQLSEFTNTKRKCTCVLLDVGAGKGANFAYFPPNVSVICLEPDPLMRDELERNVTNYPDLTLEKVICGFSEDMSEIASESVDVVMATYILCSVNDIKQSLREMHRVLKKGGKYIYLEHIAAEKGTWIKTFQTIIYRVWQLVFCRLDVNAHEYIKEAGFSQQKDEHFTVQQLEPVFSMFTVIWPHVLRPQLIGVATK